MRAALLHYPDEEAIEEERVGETANAVKEQRHGQVGMRETEDEKQHMEYKPPDDADEHDAARREDVGQHSGEPTGNCGGGAVDGEDQCGIASGEAEVDEVLRQKRLLDAITGHAEDDGDIAAEKREGHA